ncbi:hypothetical protein DPMN_036680 [Dreissena polymorpha]|uniref:Uncharacterized protein n=1 Tax=Dreissena polymorpha TaxID=45954 RepID=A0A9D4MBZ4_DREPO|nr:hypothetical protein DPMN_036680 [Dreissena polymorpha]
MKTGHSTCLCVIIEPRLFVACPTLKVNVATSNQEARVHPGYGVSRVWCESSDQEARVHPGNGVSLATRRPGFI